MYVDSVVTIFSRKLKVIDFANDFTKQRYQLIEPKLVLQSHYTDSTHVNHTVGLGFYNLQNLNREAENNVNLNVDVSMFLNKEKINIGFRI